MAHLAFGGPFGELHLADELGLDPGGVRFVGNLSAIGFDLVMSGTRSACRDLSDSRSKPVPARPT